MRAGFALHEHTAPGPITIHALRGRFTASFEDETRPLEEWLTVRESDVFPEMFPRFLGVPAELRNALIESHGEIFEASWWRDVQQGIAGGDYSDIPPYPPALRLRASDS